MPEAFKIELGSVMPMRPCRRTANDQALIYRASGLDADGAALDPFLALIEGIHAIGDAVRDGYAGWGAVITSQVVTISGRHPVGAPAFVRGRITGLEARQRGPVFETAITAVNAADEAFAETITTIQLLDPSAQPEKTERPPQRMEPSPTPAFETIGHFTFTPEVARCFERGLPPSLHTDLAIARAAGFPKPIVSGNQVFSILWNGIASPRHAPPVELRFTLKRAIFWDETVTFDRRFDDPAVRETIEVRNANGKAAIICEILAAHA